MLRTATKANWLTRIALLLLSVILLAALGTAFNWIAWKQEVDGALRSSRLGYFRDAEAHFRRSIELAQFFGNSDARLTPCLIGLAAVYESRRQFAKAEQRYRQVLEMHRSMAGAQVATASDLVNLGRLYKRQQQFDKAESLLKEALHLYESAGKSDSREAAWLLDYLGWVLGKQGKLAEAQGVLMRSLKIHESTNDPQIVITMLELAWLANAQGDWPASERLLADTARLLDNQLKEIPGDPQIAVALTTMANLYRDHGRTELARRFYNRALTMIAETAVSGPNNLFMTDILKSYAVMLRKLGDEKGAAVLDAQAEEIKQATGSESMIEAQGAAGQSRAH